MKIDVLLLKKQDPIPAVLNLSVSDIAVCRWIVIMPRYPSPVAPAGTERLVRTLLVSYKGRDQVVPVLKVWLDGAIARPVVGYKGSANLQCALVLHRLHAAPSGAHLTGDQGAQPSSLPVSFPVVHCLMNRVCTVTHSVAYAVLWYRMLLSVLHL